MGKDDASSPTISMEAIMLTAVIDAIEERHVITVDTTNAFVQTDISTDKQGDRIVMVIKGPLVDMLIQIELETYQSQYVVEKGRKCPTCKLRKQSMVCYNPDYYIIKKFERTLKSMGSRSTRMIHVLPIKLLMANNLPLHGMSMI